MPKRLKLKNHSTKKTVQETLTEMKDLLISSGAIGYKETYSSELIVGRHPIAICFAFEIDPDPTGQTASDRTMWYKFAPNFVGLQSLFIGKAQYPNTESTHQQIWRTGWRNIYDRTVLDLMDIEAKLATPMEKFTAYAYDAGSDETFYQKLEKTGMRHPMLPEYNN